MLVFFWLLTQRPGRGADRLVWASWVGTRGRTRNAACRAVSQGQAQNPSAWPQVAAACGGTTRVSPPAAEACGGKAAPPPIPQVQLLM